MKLSTIICHERSLSFYFYFYIDIIDIVTLTLYIFNTVPAVRRGFDQ